MATYTDNYNLTKPTFAEVADIRTINGNMDTIDDIMHASQVSLADAYDQTATYNTGDVVMYEFLMYKCKEDNVTGNWDASKWERTTAAEAGGEASDLTVKVPEVISTGDKACYVKRSIPTAGALAEGQKLIGATLAWNQLVDSGTTSVTIASGHKYIKYSGGAYTKGTSDGTAVSVSSGDLFFDITQMFGSTIADSLTTAQFSALFPETTYAYESGKLESVNVSGHKISEKNYFDGSLYNGQIGSTGSYTSILTRITNAPQTQSNTLFLNRGTYTIDADGLDFITALTKNSEYNIVDNFAGSWNSLPFTFTLTADAYLYFSLRKSDNSQISPTDYEVMLAEGSTIEQTTYPLDSSKEFRGLYQLVNGELRADGDIYEADGNVTRKYGIATFDGSENWINVGGQYPFAFSLDTGLTNVDQSSLYSQDGVSNLFVWKQEAVPSDDGIRWQAPAIGGKIYVYAYGFSDDLVGFKNYLSNNNLTIVYKLNTPTTETANPYNNPQIVDADGTEEFIDYGVSQGTRDVEVPVGHESSFYDYTDGSITIPDLPFADGTYALSVTMNNGAPTFSWEGGN